AGTWRTWVLASGSQLRPAPPPPIGSPENLAEAREVMRAKDELTPEQQRFARYWEGGEGTSLPPGIWNEVALAYAARDRLSTPRAARLFALLNVSQADAGVAAWDAKYVYWYPRPENTIRDLVDPNWTPLLQTPLFPAYVSGHAVYSGAAGEVMGYLFPAELAQFRAKAEEAAISRVYGGIHWPVDSEDGLPMGREIGRLVVEWARADGSDRQSSPAGDTWR
ncbi:MAG: vanadium-dependent haloperoxidase, partial [Actinomycetota bacterium]|nr:vanadium-dependent haloperoxidase [Actinomycetota bacterium]